MKRKYKGYAQSIGFDPIQAPDTTRRMAEQDNRMLRGMEAQRAAMRQNREVVSDGMSRANQLEAANREQNYQFDKQNRRINQEAESRNRQILIENANRQAAAQVNQLAPLAEFSEALSKVVTGYEEARSEAAMMEAYNEVMLNGLPSETAAQTQAVEGAINAQDEQIQQVADGLQARGAGPEIVFGVRSIGKSRELGRMKAMIQLAGASYGDWLEQQFIEDNQTQIQVGDQVLTPADAAGADPATKAAVREVLRMRFLKINGLFGAKPAMLADGLVRMREAEMQMASRDRNAWAQVQSDRLDQDVEATFETAITTNPGQAVNDYIRNKSRVLGRDGRTPIGPREALESLKERLRKAPPGVVTEEMLAQIEATAPFNQPTTTYGKQFPWFFQELRDEIEEDRRREFQQQEADEAIAQKQMIDQFREYVTTNDVPREQILGFIKQFRDRFGRVPAELNEYLDAYGVLPGFNVTTEELDEQLSAAAQDGTLTLGQLNDPRVPRELRQKYLQEAMEIQKRSESTPESKAAKSAIDNALAAKLSAYKDIFGNSLPSVTLEYAKSMAFRKYQELTRTLSAGSPDEARRAQAANDALKQVLTEIQGNAQGSSFFVPELENIDISKDKPEFPNILSQITGDPRSAVANTAGAQKLVKGIQDAITKVGNPSVLDSHLLVPLPILTAAVEQYKAGNYQVPEIVQMIATQLRGKVSPYEIIDRQLKARGINEQIVPPVAVQAASQLDPRLQQILSFNPSYQRSRRATLSAADYTPFLSLIASKESTSYGGYDAMNRGGRAGGTVAIGSANSRNVFGRGLSEMTIGEVMQLQASGQLHAAGRYQIIQSTLAGLMNGSYGPMPFKPTDRFDQAAQDQMALSLAKFRLKRGGANPVNLREEFRNEWVGFRKVPDDQLDAAIASLRQAATSPYRSPDFMSPRLVYHIASLGYGSTGPHLDVKPVAPGTTKGDSTRRISKTELDKYVSVKKGDTLVPISMGTTTTDDDYRHRSRGSFGHDFAAPEGTGVYLKNGARIVENTVDNSKQGQGSHRLVIELPDGRRYAFLHGTAAKGIG